MTDKPDKTRVAVLDDYQPIASRMADWSRLGPRVEVVFFDDHFAAADAATRLESFDIVVAMRERTPFPRELIEALPRLRLLITTGMKNASIDMQAARDRNLPVCGTGSTPYPTAELAWGLLLSLARHIPHEDAALRAGRWQTTVGTGMNGKTLGIVGLGNLGARMARIALAFEMNVLAWSQNLTAERASAAGATRVDKDELFARADAISIHLVLSDRTRGLIGARELALMKPTAWLLNTSRAAIVDELALCDALQRHALAGAGLDVFGPEPIPADHPLLRAPNTVLTPHLGYVTKESYRIYFADAIEDIQAFLRGAPVRVLNP